MRLNNLLFFMIFIVAGLCIPAYAGYDLIWSDEFEGDSLNTSNWNYDIGDGCPNLCGWGNMEFQYYRAENVTVSGGYLTIEAREESYDIRDYTSGKIHSKGKQDFLYGKIETKMKVPTGGAIWPAFWMMPTDNVYGGWPRSGEIDIMETCNDTDYIGGTIHYETPTGWRALGGRYEPNDINDFSDDFHIYAIEWEPDEIRWYVDDICYFAAPSSMWCTTGDLSNDRAPFDEYFYPILNVAVGGYYTGCTSSSCVTATLPQQMIVDYVRVYHINHPNVVITNPIAEANLPSGDILIEADVSSPDSTTIATVEFYNRTNYLGEDTNEPYSFNWASVSDGCYTIVVKAIDANGVAGEDSVHIAVGSGCPQLPYNGSPSDIPGQIEAEDFDLGGEGVAYHDIDMGNNGGEYRTTEDIDIEICSEGGYNVTLLDAFEWLEYTVDINKSGTYTIETRVASKYKLGSFHLEFDGLDRTGGISVPKTGGNLQTWGKVTASVNLFAGTQTMRFVREGEPYEYCKYNLNYFNFIFVSSEVTVPDVIGMDESSAELAIALSALTVGTTSYSHSETVAVGYVISQNPIGGSSAEAGSSIDLEVSLGIRGDLNNDDAVDFYDVYTMAGEWLTSGTLADIEPAEGNGIVDFKDFAVLAGNWAESVE
jgi:beta-glucanase (GH16 family)